MQHDPLMYVDGMNDLCYVFNNSLNYIDVYGTRNIVADFLFGGCLDVFENWDCSNNWERAGNIALCGLDVAGFIPGIGWVAKGAKGASLLNKAAKLGKAANKIDNAVDASKAANKGTAVLNQYDKNGFPLNYGAVGGWTKDVLPKGHKIDRYDRFGTETGEFFADAGTPVSKRSLDYTPSSEQLYTYEVIDDLPVWKSITAPAYGQPGGGIQYVSEQYQSIQSLIAGGYLRKIR